jgi:hypothetical protein
MSRIKSFVNWISEAKDDVEKYADIKEEVDNMFKETVDESGGELDSMKLAYSQNPKDIKIRGFINDSEIYDFYLKFRNDIDQILNDINYFDDTPQEKNAFGLYEYVVKGTERAFLEVVKMIS